MSKVEDKISVVESQLGLCVTSSASYYTYGNIPYKRFTGAKKNYAKDVRYDDVIGLVDTTILGGGERGMLLTLEGVYVKEMLTEPIYCSYENIEHLVLPSDTYYKLQNLCTMLMELNAVEIRKEEDFWGNMLNVAGTIISDAIKTYQDTLENQESIDDDIGDEYVIEQLKNGIDTIKGIKTKFTELLVDYDDFEKNEDVCARIFEIMMQSILYSAELETCRFLFEEHNNEWEDEWNKFNECKEPMDEVLAEFESDGVETLTSIFSSFSEKMNSIINTLINDGYGNNMNHPDWDILYEKSQDAVRAVRKKLIRVINIIDEILEFANDEES